LDPILDIFNRYSQPLANIACVVLVIFMSLTVANSVLFFLENRGPLNLQSATSPITSPRQNTATVDIAALSLFGNIQQQAAPAAIVDAPVTRLNLELQGVFAAENDQDSSAIIAQARKPGELYRVGDKVPGNATLHAVLNDHVLLKRGSRIEKLVFAEKSLSGFDSNSSDSGSSASTGGTELSSRTRLQEVRERIINRNRSAGRPQGNQEYSGLRDTINEYREKINNDPQSVLQELGVEPVSSGESAGYKIGSDISNPALQQAGLRPGDVILSVNGRPVGDLSNDAAMIDQVMSSRRVRVEIQRETRRFFLTIPVPG